MLVTDTKGNIKVATSIQENETLWIAKGFDIEWLVAASGRRYSHSPEIVRNSERYSSRLHRTTFGGQLYTYCCFVPCGSEQISLNCMYLLPNTRSIPLMNTYLNPITVSISI